MRLMIRGEEAQKGMKVTNFRGEEFVLIDWRSPTEPLGGATGKVYCQTREEYEEKKITCYEWYPSVIGGIFEPAE